MAARGLAANASWAGLFAAVAAIRAIGALLERTRQAFSARIPSLTQKERFSTEFTHEVPMVEYSAISSNC
jgi:hypothetical protein